MLTEMKNKGRISSSRCGLPVPSCAEEVLSGYVGQQTNSEQKNHRRPRQLPRRELREISLSWLIFVPVGGGVYSLVDMVATERLRNKTRGETGICKRRFNESKQTLGSSGFKTIPKKGYDPSSR